MPRPTKLRSQRDINLWRIPLQLSLAAVALFGITLIPDILDKYGVIHIPSWLTMGSIDDARAILSAMMGAVATVLALIFSVALLVLSMVATLFGPRLLYRFLQDWVTQVTIGMFMGTFVYICLVFLVTHQDPQSSFIPQISLITSWVLVVLSFGFLVYYSHRVAKSIQNPDMIGAIVDDLYVAAGGAHVSGPGEGTGAAPDDAAILRQAETGAIVSCPKSGYLQHVDHGALVAAARAADALIVLRFRPGQFVLRGEPLAAIVPAVERRPARGGDRSRTSHRPSPHAHARQRVRDRAGRRDRDPRAQPGGQRHVHRRRVRRLARRRAAHAGRAAPARGKLVRHRRRAPRVDAAGPARAPRQARVRSDPSGVATTPAVLIRQLDAIRRLAPRFQTPAVKRFRSKPTRSLDSRSARDRERAGPRCLIAATSTRRGAI
jgi:hypothetical protein